MVINSKKQVFRELEMKFYEKYEDELIFMKNDLDKIMESFCLAEKELDKLTKNDLEKAKKEAFDKLDIIKIKTLNEEINNIESE